MHRFAARIHQSKRPVYGVMSEKIQKFELLRAKYVIFIASVAFGYPESAPLDQNSRSEINEAIYAKNS